MEYKPIRANVNGEWIDITDALQEENKYLRDKVEQLQDKIDSAINYMETLQIDEYDSNGYWIRHNGKEDLSIEKTKNELLDILKGSDNSD